MDCLEQLNRDTGFQPVPASLEFGVAAFSQIRSHKHGLEARVTMERSVIQSP
jgi:hypothetical protein